MEEKNLFVSEEDDMSHTAEASPEPQHVQASASASSSSSSSNPSLDLEDDPILRSIPLVHGGLPHRQLQSLHVFQYPGRPKKQGFAESSLKAMVKPASRVVQVKTPMNTAKFYNEGRAEELGARVESVALQGVLTPTNGGLYAGRIIENDGVQKIVLIPLDSTAQLRPLFKYMDDLDSARHQAVRQENQASDPSKLSAVQVLQTASKTGNNPTADGHLAGGVGACLRHVKRFNEEDWLSLSWFGAGDSSTDKIVDKLANPREEPVEASTVLDEFL